MRRISLWEFRGIGVIVAHPSGVHYSNQAGGYLCSHPEIEGVFLPLAGPDTEWHTQLDQHFFYGEKYAGHCYRGIDEETARFLDVLLASSPVSRGITVDRDRLAESIEAWIYVTIAPGTGDDAIAGFDGATGVLTWQNSD
jgi:hypothetical protein